MNEFECKELVELVTDFVEGALDADTRRRVVHHLAECDGCDAYMEQLRTTVVVLGMLPSDRLPDRARQALLAAFAAER